jgi:hypothetical protein
MLEESAPAASRSNILLTTFALHKKGNLVGRKAWQGEIVNHAALPIACVVSIIATSAWIMMLDRRYGRDH